MKPYTHFEFSGRFLKNYDRFNHLASMGLDRRWRRVTARRAAAFYRQRGWNAPVLDLACGTGDMAAAIHQVLQAVVIGSDPSAEMLDLAATKKNRRGWSRFHPVRAVSRLPLADASVGAITCAFGVRNFVHLQQDMDECRRVLQPGGRIYLLDFYKPQNRFSHGLLQVYKKIIAPAVGALITGQAKPYRYLMESMYAFRSPQAMMEVLTAGGLQAVDIHPFFFGLVHLVVAEKKIHSPQGETT